MATGRHARLVVAIVVLSSAGVAGPAVAADAWQSTAGDGSAGHGTETEGGVGTEVSKVVSTADLVVGQRNESQRVRLIVLHVPAGTATVRMNLSALTEANASLRNASVTHRLDVPDRGVAVRRVSRRNATLELVVEADRRGDRVAVELRLTGIDTRNATETTGLSYPIHVEVPAGTATGESEPFGLYAPGETPTPTETPVVDPPFTGGTSNDTTATTSGGTRTTTEGDGAGFTGVAAAVALGLVAVGTRRLDS
jgi:hypothetical protein